jgi:hypothetical protein
MGDGIEQADRIHDRGSEGAQDFASQAEVITVRFNPAVHRADDFVCARSERIQGFFKNEYPRYVARNYCRVFALPDPSDAGRIWGFYTLSLGLVQKDQVTTQHQKKVERGLPIPMARIGFLGRDDSVPKDRKLGGILIHDAALRVYLCEDMTAWGLYLDAENDSLASWYEHKMGFKPTKSAPRVMYAPLRALLPGMP